MRIVLADHHLATLRALHMLVQEEQGLDIAGEAANATALLELAAVQAPDLVLMDGELPGVSIEELIEQLHAHEPRPIVIVMSNQDDFGRRREQAGRAGLADGDPAQIRGQRTESGREWFRSKP